MKSSLLKRGLLAGVAFAGTVAAVAPAVPAHAQTATPAAGEVVITAGGSDTTEKVMNEILSGAPAGQIWVNLPSFPTANVTVPGDANCPTMDWTPNGTTPTLPDRQAPAGSGSGRGMLNTVINDNATYGGVPAKGCLDIARSSSFSSTSPNVGTGEFYAFALDAVSWASGSLAAPGSMTLDDLRDVYNCTVTDWAELPGGGSGPIQRYMPQSGSGTYGFFKDEVLGFDPGTFSTGDCPAVLQVDKDGSPLEENRADRLPDADWQKAIFPFSAGQWVYQANNSVNPTIDHRKSPTNGYTAKLGGIAVANAEFPGNVQNANMAGWNRADGQWQLNDAGLEAVQPGDPGGYPVLEENTKMENPTPVFPGVRFLYNVLDTRSPNYDEAAGVVAFDNVPSGTKSPLCDGAKSTVISSFGFSPLTSTANATSNQAGSTCRAFTI